MEVAEFSLSSKALIDLEDVLCARDGNERAFEALHNRYKDAIYFMMLRMVGNASDAEDLTIEAFGKAFRNIHQYVPRYAFSSWLFRIATNNCIDYIRNRNKQISDTIDYETLALSLIRNDLSRSHQEALLPTPEDRLIARQSLDRIRSIVDKLRPQYRQLITLRFFEEYTYEEISAEMSLPMGTVKAQLHRAKALLARMLTDADNPLIK